MIFFCFFYRGKIKKMHTCEEIEQTINANRAFFDKMTEDEIVDYFSTPDKLFYFSGSRDVKPGKGTNEHVSVPSKYSYLEGIKDWRKILSNFHLQPFTWQGKTWNTVEHAFQASKIALVDKNKAKSFTLESGSVLGRGSGADARKQRKMVVLSPEKLKYWAKIKDDVMEDIIYHRYKNEPDLQKVLLATGDAELWHVVLRSKPEHVFYLERVRSRIRDKK